jgi:hypothetical protein
MMDKQEARNKTCNSQFSMLNKKLFTDIFRTDENKECEHQITNVFLIEFLINLYCHKTSSTLNNSKAGKTVHQKLLTALLTYWR